MTRKCSETPVFLHDLKWTAPNECVDGGILRAKNTYTNLDTSGFKTPVGYSGHFYGIRKYDGLIPHAPYSIIIEGKTGSGGSIKTPLEFTEIEYGSNNFIDYSGYKLPTSSYKYGKSVSAKQNYIAVGSPFDTIYYSELDSSGNTVTFNLEKAGSVHVYRREDRPSGYHWPEDKHKSPWVLDEIVTLPSGFIKDFYNIRYKNSVGGIPMPLPIQERFWQVGQEGREFGHSIDLSVTNSGDPSIGESNRKILVVGAPSARWNNRSFEELSSSGVQIGLMIFTDEFVPIIYSRNNSNTLQSKDHTRIQSAFQDKDLIFQYFSDPPVKFDIKLIICEPIADFSNRQLEDFPEPKPNYIVKKRIARNQGIVTEDRTNVILNDIKAAFHEAFPYDETKLNNNIPVILGIYVDDSASLGKQAISPALSRFISYFGEYSFASGLKDFYGVQSSGQCIEFPTDDTESEDWIENSKTILDYVLDTGRLVKENQVRFFTSGVGLEAFNANLSQFNYPPPSGGSVFIFEKESGSWNCIQEIPSPNIIYDTPDRFGHAVAISDNTEVISIGSPYINQSCQIYEYKKEEKNRLYNSLHTWLYHKSSITGGSNLRYTSLISSFQEWLNSMDIVSANKLLYCALTPTEKLEARKFLEISEYQLATTYSVPSITLSFPKTRENKKAEDWRFIIDTFAPTPRCGYSVAVSEDGNLVAIGSPTDSFNKGGDARVYYKNEGYTGPLLSTTLINSSWNATVNAGSVTLLESRKYYPHNSVVEFGKFGNLQEDIGDPIDSGHFGYLSNIFRDKNFRKTDFSEVKIPEEAGLAFIITPAIDALSEEVLENIASWLALGDRNLVLVGNDPSWEQNGAYAESNNIINRILSYLKSRMTLVPARNYFEALIKPSGCGKVIPSFVPLNSTNSYVIPQSLNAYGVADIRMNLEDTTFELSMPCGNAARDDFDKTISMFMDPAPANMKCELPLKHMGDLRAQWNHKCINDKLQTILVPVNWATLFKTYPASDCAVNFPPVYKELPNQEPVPLLAAADLFTETITIPAKPASFTQVPIFREESSTTVRDYTFFDAANVSSGISIIWHSGISNYTNINYNINSSTSSQKFYRPDIFEERQSLLQANGIPMQEIIKSQELASPFSYLAIEENLSNNSKIICIASTEIETPQALISGGGDKNLYFYINLVSKPFRRGESRIAQLGGWTGHDSFSSATPNSMLYEVFTNSNNDVELNAKKPSSGHDVCWIADPIGLPNNQQLQELLSWLRLPNKKLIVTYSNQNTKAKLVTDLMSMLNSKIQPLYLLADEKFANSNVPDRNVRILPGTYIANGYDKKSKITSLGVNIDQFIPLKLADGTSPLAYSIKEVYQTKLDTVGYWRFDSGITKVTFPSVANSGYRLFFTSISESPSEVEPISIYIDNVTRAYDLPNPPGLDIRNIPLDDGFTFDRIGIQSQLSRLAINEPSTQHFDVQATSNEISVYVSAYNSRSSIVTSDFVPKTTRLLAVSGVMAPIIKTRTSTQDTRFVFSGFSGIQTSPAQPEISLSSTRFGPISNKNDQYCKGLQCIDNNLHNQLIADGPVVAAQEIEHFSPFEAGFNRSRITLISDSSLVQGKCMGDEFYRASNESVTFLRSLYPETFFGGVGNGRSFAKITKIVSPERGSPAKYLTLSPNNSGINNLFNGGYMEATTSLSFGSFNNDESRYDPQYVIDPMTPYSEIPEDGDQEIIEQLRANKRREEISKFITKQNSAGSTAKFSGIIDGKMYADASYEGGLPQLLIDKGYDYLDVDKFTNSYKGDLFGYDVGIYKNKVIVSSPGSAFSNQNVADWAYHANNSGLRVGYDGGAGAVYIFEQTFQGSGYSGFTAPWECTQKLRPQSLQVGISGSASDKFGSCLDISSDIIAIGAPQHNFGNFYINGSGDFIRKSFNSEFTIPPRTVLENLQSGIQNNGAIYLFENSIVDWPTKTQKWSLIEKLTPEMFGSDQENGRFGYSVSIDRSNRTDSDYTICAGSLRNSGEAYTCDIMLRDTFPSVQSPEAFIQAKVFGEIDQNWYPNVFLEVKNGSLNDASYYASGIIYTDSKGQIFLEASGQDPVAKGFIQHRPFIKSINGQYAYGNPNSGIMSLFVLSNNIPESENMTIFTQVDNSAIVYNNIGMFTGAVTDIVSSSPSGLYLYTDCPDPITVFSSGLTLYTASGIGSSDQSLNMRIRGK